MRTLQISAAIWKVAAGFGIIKKMNWLTRRTTLLISSTGSGFFLMLVLVVPDACLKFGVCRFLRNALAHDFLIFIAIFPVMLLFSLLTYKAPESVFNAWKRFSIWAVPLVALISIFIANDPKGGDVVGLGEAIKFAGLFGIFGIYALVSLIIIILAWLKERKRSRENVQ